MSPRGGLDYYYCDQFMSVCTHYFEKLELKIKLLT